MFKRSVPVVAKLSKVDVERWSRLWDECW